MNAPSAAFAAVAGMAAKKRGYLTRQKSYHKKAGKTWCVACDGSRLSIRALRLAAALHVEGNDKIKVFTVETPGNTDADRVIKDAETELLSVCKVNKMSIVHGQKLQVEGSIADTIRKAAEKEHEAILVMGSAGRGAQDAEGKTSRPKGQAPMSKMAEACVKECSVPILLVKKAYFTLDNDDAMRERAFDTGKQPCRMVCTVNDPNHGKEGWEAATRIARPGDVVDALHVLDSDKVSRKESLASFGSSAVIKYFTEEAAKVTDTSRAACSCVSVYKVSSIGETVLKYSDGEIKEKASEPADLIIMNSYELATSQGKDKDMGSVTLAVAKKTETNMLICKSFSQMVAA